MYRGSAMATGLLFAGLGVLGLSHEAAGQAGGQGSGPPSKMITLTDGRDMKNFDQVGNASWRIAERAIAADKGAGYLVTKETYGDFRIRAEFWDDEGTNSGVFIRCEDPKNPNAMSCYEVNIFDRNPNAGNATGAIVNVAKVDRAPQKEFSSVEVGGGARQAYLNAGDFGDSDAAGAAPGLGPIAEGFVGAKRGAQHRRDEGQRRV